MTAEHWDLDITRDELKRLSPADKGRRVAASLSRKIFLLEAWAKAGAPDDAEVPTDRAKLRRWHDPQAGLWPWSDPAVDAPDGPNAALIKRFASAVEVILRRKSGRGTNLRREIEARDIIIANLEWQNAELLDRVRRLQQQVETQPTVRR